MRCTGTYDFRIWREEPPIKWTVSIKMLLIEKVVGGKLWTIHYSCKGVLELKVWKLFFSEYVLSLPFWSLSFSFVSGSDPLNFIFLLEKSQIFRQLMVWTECPLREMTLSGWRTWGIELTLWLGEVLGGGCPVSWVPEFVRFILLYSHRHPGSWAFYLWRVEA